MHWLLNYINYHYKYRKDLIYTMSDLCLVNKNIRLLPGAIVQWEISLIFFLFCYKQCSPHSTAVFLCFSVYSYYFVDKSGWDSSRIWYILKQFFFSFYFIFLYVFCRLRTFPPAPPCIKTILILSVSHLIFNFKVLSQFLSEVFHFYISFRAFTTNNLTRWLHFDDS